MPASVKTVKALAVRWKALGAAERAPFEAEAASLKEQWKKDLAAWCAPHTALD